MIFKKYLNNCFLLLLPIFLWNILLFDSLPAAYSSDEIWNNVPNLIIYCENGLRVFVFGISLIMMLSIKTKTEKVGLLLYLVGTLIYFLSWSLMIYYPESNWSRSAAGFMAPAYSTILWLVGIGFIGNTSFLKLPKISTMYFFAAFLFVLIHSMHAYLVFEQL